MATSLFPPASDAKAQRLGKWEKPKGKPSALAAASGGMAGAVARGGGGWLVWRECSS